MVSQHGRPDNGSDASPFSNVELFVPLKPYDEWPSGLTKDKLTEELQGEFSDELPGVGFNFSQYIQDNVEEAISGVKGANSVKIVGPNLEVLEKLATQINDQMKQVRGVADLGIFHVVGQPNLNIEIDRQKAARYGLNTGDVNTVDPGGDGRHDRDDGAGRRSPVQSHGSSGAQTTATASTPLATSRSATKLPPEARRIFRCASSRRLPSIPGHPTSTTRPRSGLFRSSSAFVAATSAAPSPRRRSGLPRM